MNEMEMRLLSAEELAHVGGGLAMTNFSAATIASSAVAIADVDDFRCGNVPIPLPHPIGGVINALA